MTEEVTIVAPKLDLLTLSDGPALSSGSDRPAAVVVDATDTEARPEAKEAEDKATADKEKATADAVDGKEPTEDSTPSWQKALISREKNRRKAVEETLARTQQQLDEALALAHKYAPAAADQQKPQRDNFADDDTYVDALTTWKADRIVQKREEDAQKRAAEAREQKIWTNHAERMAAAEETDPGITDIAQDPTLPVNEAMAAAIKTSDLGPAILRWIDNNRTEAKRIAQLHPARAAAEIGKIEASLAAPKAPVPRAPKPISPLGGRNNAGPKTIGEMSSEEWGAHLDAERAKKLAVQRGTQVSVTK